MKYLYLIVTIFFSASIFFSCSEESVIGPKDETEGGDTAPAVLMPLIKGNTWTYNEIRISNGGDRNDEAVREFAVVGANGKVFNLSGDLSVISFEKAKNSDEGLYLYDYSSDMKSLQREYFFPYPVKIGSNYEYSFNGYEIKVALNEKEVQAGKFKCYTYTYNFDGVDDIPHVEIFSFCPKTGLIKWERKDAEENQALLDLVEFDVQ
jgi:hypothetical protein